MEQTDSGAETLDGFYVSGDELSRCYFTVLNFLLVKPPLQKLRFSPNSSIRITEF